MREQRNCHYLMALSRKNTELENLDEDLKLFSNCLTPYAFKFVQEQLQSLKHVQVLNQLNGSQFSLFAAKNVKEPQQQHHRSAIALFSPVWVYDANAFSLLDLCSTCRLSAKALCMSDGLWNIINLRSGVPIFFFAAERNA